MTDADQDDVEQAIEAAESKFEWVNSPQPNTEDTIDHVLIPGDTWPDELAIFDADEQTADGQWLSAIGEGESFVDLWEVR